MGERLRILVFAAALLALAAPAGARQAPAVERFSFTPYFGCDTILAILDGAAMRAREQSAGAVFVVAYPAPDTPPGNVIQYLRFTKQHLSDRFGAAGRDVVTGVGPAREFFSVDVVIVPPGGAPPLLTPVALRYGIVAGRYAEGGLGVYGGEQDWFLGAEICALENVDLFGFAEAVTALPGSTGYVVLHPGRSPDSGRVRGAVRAVRARLAETGVPPERFRFVVAPPRDDWPSADLWVVPRGERPPKPGPRPPDRSCFSDSAWLGPRVTRHLGDLTNKAVSLPRPNLARDSSVGVSGEVRLDVIVDLRTGEPVWAQVTGGHALLRQAVVDVACGIRLAPIGARREPAFADGYVVFRFPR